MFITNHLLITLVFTGCLIQATMVSSEAKYLKLPNLTKQKATRNSKRLRKRNVEGLDFKFENYWYSTTIKLGSYDQELQVQVDTGSSYLWVTSGTDYNCIEYNPIAGNFNCTEITYFDAVASDTFTTNLTYFGVQYSGGDGAWGFWGSDRLTVDTAVIKNFEFGVAQYSTSDVNVLGVGLPSDESERETNLAFMLVDNGYTRKALYSIDIDSTESSMMFGAIDQERFIGTLYTAPMVATDTQGEVTEVAITLSSLGLVDEDGVINKSDSDSPVAAVMDTGTTFTIFPPSFVEVFLGKYGLAESEDGTYPMSCSTVNKSSIAFNFQGFEIHVPLTEFVDSTSDDGETCTVILWNSGYESMALLGDSFLKVIYYVVDLNSLEISLATVKQCPTEEKIVEVYDTIPGAERIPDYENYFKAPEGGVYV